MGPLLEFRLRAARPSGVDGRVTVRKGVLPCAGWRSFRAVGKPAGPAPRGVGLQCCVSTSGGARPPRWPWCHVHGTSCAFLNQVSFSRVAVTLLYSFLFWMPGSRHQ